MGFVFYFISSDTCYFCQWGYVFGGLFVCLSVSKIKQKLPDGFAETSGDVGNGPASKRLDFGLDFCKLFKGQILFQDLLRSHKKTAWTVAKFEALLLKRA